MILKGVLKTSEEVMCIIKEQKIGRGGEKEEQVASTVFGSVRLRLVPNSKEFRGIGLLYVPGPHYLE